MRHRIAIFGLFLIYILVATAIMIWAGIGIVPDRYVFVLLFAAFIVKRLRGFLFDWTPFIMLLISYDFLRGLVPLLNNRVHFLEQMNLDLWLFKKLPTATLQQWFYHPGSPQWYDYLATILYFLHFALPLAFGFFLWLQNKHRFKEFVLAISLLSYFSWITYVVFPAAPPWLAQQDGYLSGIYKILDQTLKIFPQRIDLPTIYHNINPNPVAAIPSLHAAYPLLVLMFAVRYFKTRGLWFTPYVLLTWVSIIYLGEHYVTDILVSIVYTLAFYLITIRAKAIFKAFSHSSRKVWQLAKSF